MNDIPESFNLDNPPYRDGFYTLPVEAESTWMAVRYQVVNPGVRHSDSRFQFAVRMSVLI